MSRYVLAPTHTLIRAIGAGVSRDVLVVGGGDPAAALAPKLSGDVLVAAPEPAVVDNGFDDGFVDGPGRGARRHRRRGQAASGPLSPASPVSSCGGGAAIPSRPSMRADRSRTSAGSPRIPRSEFVISSRVSRSESAIGSRVLTASRCWNLIDATTNASIGPMIAAMIGPSCDKLIAFMIRPLPPLPT